jgi:1-acyl-sn-glycerol-3-phosphate acyltransferase
MGFKAWLSTVFTLTLCLPSGAAVAGPITKTEIHLLTMGVGDHLYTRGGHAALLVAKTRDDGRVESIVYNYGDTDWEQPSIAMKFMTGELNFFVSESGSIQDTVQRYGFGQNRDIYRQPVALTQHQAETLVRRLEETLKPENRNYTYHHLERICTTKVRDMLDEVLHGAIAKTLTNQKHDKSIRQHQRFGTDGQNLVALASGLFLGRSHDRKPDKYFMTFLPHLMRDYLQEVRVPDPAGSGELVPLLGAPLQLYRRRGPPACTQENRITSHLGFAWLGVVVFIGLWVYRRLGRGVRLAGWWLLFWSLPSTVIGLVSLLSIGFSGVAEFRDNELIFSFPPSDIILVLLALRWTRGKHDVPPLYQSYVLVRLGVLLGVFLAHGTGFFFQEPFILPCLSLVSVGFLWFLLHALKGAQKTRDDKAPEKSHGHLTHETDRCSLMAHLFGRFILMATGWRNEGSIAKGKQFVVIAAPHTSNWDLLYMLAGAWTAGVHLSWFGKKELFHGMSGWLLKQMGGIPVDRSGTHGVVEQLVDLFAQNHPIALAVPPSGTRKFRDGWKSGFYHIAHGAQVPIVCCYLDYGRKVTGIGPAITPTGQITSDMDRIRPIYDGVCGKYPERVSRIHLKEEGEQVAIEPNPRPQGAEPTTSSPPTMGSA